MRCETTDDPNELWRLTEPFLTADPVVNNMPMTLLQTRREGKVVDGEPPLYLAVFDGDRAVGVAIQTPPRNLVLTHLPTSALPLLAERIHELRPTVPGVVAPSVVAAGFAAAWAARTGATYGVAMEQRIHRLGALRPPAGVSGRPHLATSADTEQVLTWSLEFGAEMGHVYYSLEQVRPDVDLRIGESRAYLWLDGSGRNGQQPVSYAGHTPLVCDVIRIGPVYTPHQWRGRGYASALVAEVSRLALEKGARNVTLYTDLANRTSNRIYASIGYEPVCDVTAFHFA